MNPRFSHMRNFWKWYILSLLFLVSVLLWVCVLGTNDGVLTFTVLDVGQGDALFIESPTGIQVLVDGGPNRTVTKEVSRVMSFFDRHIDMLVVTHADRDHYEGLIPLLGKYKTDVILYSGTVSDSALYKSFEEVVSENSIKKVVARSGQVVDLGGGAYLQILFPDRDVSGLETNDASIVMKLVYGETSVMLQGDSPLKIEEYLISKNSEILESDILKTGHHGSRTSTGESYVKAVSPKWAVVTAGEDNSYGHPHQEVVDTLNKYEVQILGTYDRGRIVFESDGKDFVLK